MSPWTPRGEGCQYSDSSAATSYSWIRPPTRSDGGRTEALKNAFRPDQPLPGSRGAALDGVGLGCSARRRCGPLGPGVFVYGRTSSPGTRSRTVRTHRSAYALAFGDRYGVRTTSTPSKSLTTLR